MYHNIVSPFAYTCTFPYLLSVYIKASTVLQYHHPIVNYYYCQTCYYGRHCNDVYIIKILIKLTKIIMVIIYNDKKGIKAISNKCDTCTCIKITSVLSLSNASIGLRFHAFRVVYSQSINSEYGYSTTLDYDHTKQ